MAVANERPDQEDELKSWLLFGGLLLASLAGHAYTVWKLPSEISRPETTRVELVEFKVPEPPPPPPKEEPKPPEPPPPPPPKVKLKPPPVKLAEVRPPPPVEAPPPPNDPPPVQPSKPVPLIVGISMSSTSENGGIAVPVGNTAYGKADKAVDPNSVKAYAAPKYVPPGGADTEPSLASEVKVGYPDEAKRAGIEGTVRMKITIDEQGNVTDVVVLAGPGYGLNEAAREALRRFRFKPATKGGASVGTSIVYNYTFELD